jgi:DNA modification methylase
MEMAERVLAECTLMRGDCREQMMQAEPCSVDSIVTDPPYELGFMGKGWDRSGVAFDPSTWTAALRVLKPGGHLVAFGGTRTYHRMVCAIEDAGFEIRDQLAWIYGSGFPKSHNGEWGGTALKPAWEPIVLARKPLIGTVEANWQKYGTGALNIAECRIGTGDDKATGGTGGIPCRHSEHESRTGEASANRRYDTVGGTDFAMTPGPRGGDPLGRWPANIIHDGSDEVLAAFPDAPGQQGDLSGHSRDRLSLGIFGDMKAARDALARGDDGSAARFFYCAKASGEDRNEGCSGLPERTGGMVSNTSGQHITRRDGGAPGPRANHHPTVKPTDLMRWLTRLVTPKGGLVLDPFMGSGSTGKAAMLEGFRFIGMDLSDEYIEIARARIDFAARQGHQPDLLEIA